MNSDFAMARHHLERAYYYLCGDDRLSQAARSDIDALMDDFITVRLTRLSARQDSTSRRGTNASDNREAK